MIKGNVMIRRSLYAYFVFFLSSIFFASVHGSGVKLSESFSFKGGTVTATFEASGYDFRCFATNSKQTSKPWIYQYLVGEKSGSTLRHRVYIDDSRGRKERHRENATAAAQSKLFAATSFKPYWLTITVKDGKDHFSLGSGSTPGKDAFFTYTNTHDESGKNNLDSFFLQAGGSGRALFRNISLVASPVTAAPAPATKTQEKAPTPPTPAKSVAEKPAPASAEEKPAPPKVSATRSVSKSDAITMTDGVATITFEASGYDFRCFASNSKQTSKPWIYQYLVGEKSGSTLRHRVYIDDSRGRKERHRENANAAAQSKLFAATSFKPYWLTITVKDGKDHFSLGFGSTPGKDAFFTYTNTHDESGKNNLNSFFLQAGGSGRALFRNISLVASSVTAAPAPATKTQEKAATPPTPAKAAVEKPALASAVSQPTPQAPEKTNDKPVVKEAQNKEEVAAAAEPAPEEEKAQKVAEPAKDTPQEKTGDDKPVEAKAEEQPTPAAAATPQPEKQAQAPEKAETKSETAQAVQKLLEEQKPSAEETQKAMKAFASSMMAPEHIEHLQGDVIGRLESIDLSDEEKAIIKKLSDFTNAHHAFMKTIHYYFDRLDEEVHATRDNPKLDPNTITLAWLYKIIAGIKGRKIMLNKHDDVLVIERLERVVKNRELLTKAQISEVKGLIYQAEKTPALQSVLTTLKRLAEEIKTELTYSERAAKYANEVGRVSHLPQGSVEKTFFIVGVAGVLDLPGERTRLEVTNLENNILAPIKFGNFTQAQRDLLKHLYEQLDRIKAELDKKEAAERADKEKQAAAEALRKKSAPYHFDQADKEKTPTAYHAALKKVVDGKVTSSIIFADADLTTLVGILEAEVGLRPLKGAEGSELEKLIVHVSQIAGFKDNAALADRLKNMLEKAKTQFNLFERAKYFADNALATLALPADDGDRARYFARMRFFAPQLAMMSDAQLTTANADAVLEKCRQTLLLYKDSDKAQGSEKTVMSVLTKQLEISAKKAKQKIAEMKAKEEADAKRKALRVARIGSAAVATQGASSGVKKKTVSKNRFYQPRRGRGSRGVGMIYTPS